MEVGKVVPAGKVFMTIVDPQQLQLRIALDEKSLGQLAVNAPGFAIPAIMPAEKLPLRIETISRIAFADGKFDCTATLEFDNQKMILTPGMTCEIIVPSYVKTNAITVAKSSVFSDDEGLTHYVYKVTGDNKPDKATVKVGMTSGERTEIKQGLAAGDKILLKKPEPEKPESKTPAAKESEKKESK
jgi:RND family efflux transporter MFP subunit